MKDEVREQEEARAVWHETLTRIAAGQILVEKVRRGESLLPAVPNPAPPSPTLRSRLRGLWARLRTRVDPYGTMAAALQGRYPGLGLAGLKARRSVRGALREVLTEREQDVLYSYFGVGLRRRQSLVTIGRRHNLSRERVRQCKGHALRKIQQQAASLRAGERDEPHFSY